MNKKQRSAMKVWVVQESEGTTEFLCGVYDSIDAVRAAFPGEWVEAERAGIVVATVGTWVTRDLKFSAQEATLNKLVWNAREVVAS